MKFIVLLLSAFLISSSVLSSVSLAEDCGTEMAKLSAEQAAKKTDIQEAIAANKALQDYIHATSEILHERAFALNVMELALIAKEHLVFLGPPGNAKSMIASLFLGNILENVTEKDGKVVEKPSFGALQFTSETTLTETHGPLNWPELNSSGRLIRLYDEGFLNLRAVFFDEFFDARPNAQRNVLDLMAERAHKQGPRITKGRIEVAILASNKYMHQVYEKSGDDGPRAVFDRAAFTVFFPSEFESADAYTELIQNSAKEVKKLPRLTYDQVDSVRKLVQQVEIPDYVANFVTAIALKMKEETSALEQASLKDYAEKKRNGEHPESPYRATKFQSPRTAAKEGSILKAIVVRRFLKNGGKGELKANLDDLKELEQFNTLVGANDKFIEEMHDRTVHDEERAQLSAIKTERGIYREIYRTINDGVNEAIVKYSITDIGAQLARGAITGREREELTDKLVAIANETGVVANQRHRAVDLVDGRVIGTKLVYNFAVETLKDLWGNQYESKLQEIESESARKAELHRQAELKAKTEADARIKAEQARLAEAARLEQERLKQNTALLEDWSKSLTSQAADVQKTILHTPRSAGKSYFAYDSSTKTVFFYDTNSKLNGVKLTTYPDGKKVNDVIETKNGANSQYREIADGSYGEIKDILAVGGQLFIQTANTFVQVDPANKFEVKGEKSFPGTIDTTYLTVAGNFQGSPSILLVNKNLQTFSIVNLAANTIKNLATKDLVQNSTSAASTDGFAFKARELGDKFSIMPNPTNQEQLIFMAADLKGYMIVDISAGTYSHHDSKMTNSTVNTKPIMFKQLSNDGTKAYGYRIKENSDAEFELFELNLKTSELSVKMKGKSSSDVRTLVYLPDHDAVLVGSAFDGVNLLNMKGEVVEKRLANTEHLIHGLFVQDNNLIVLEVPLSSDQPQQASVIQLPPLKK